jgi:hypothetical protein
MVREGGSRDARHVVKRAFSVDAFALAVAGVFSVSVWVVTMASAPRYSYGADQDMGSNALYYVLLGAAFVGGLVLPRRAGLIGLALGLPPFVLSPWTAPRGDNDGLWIFIVPMLGIFMFVLLGAAAVGARVRTGRPASELENESRDAE